MQNKPVINKHAIAKAFSAAASTYDQAAIVEQEICARLFDRILALNLQPVRILDLGCGTGYFVTQLRTLFPNAVIIGLDLAIGMVKFASAANPAVYCCADAEQLPFLDQQFDLIVSSCCINNIGILAAVFHEINRVLKVNGAVFFTTFGPDTLKELELELPLPDMHIIGDLLMQLSYNNPVLDTEFLTFTYKQLKTLLTDLQQTGAYAIDLSQVLNLNDPCSATFEVIYGLAWKSIIPTKQYKDQQGNTYIPVSAIEFL